MEEIMEVVKDSINDILTMNGLEVTTIEEDSKLVQDLGLKSLDIAQLIAVLEAELDQDPFADGQATLANVITVGDLCKLYQ